MRGGSQRFRKGGLATWAILFALMGAFYVATFSFRNISDTDLTSYQTRALALHGDVDLTRYGDKIPNRRNVATHDGDRYSIYGIGVSLPVLPLYAILARTSVSDRTLQAVASISFVVAGALILLRLLLQLFPRAIAVGSTVIYAFGTTMWPVAAMGFFQTGPASLFQAIGLTGLFSRTKAAPALAGFGFAMAAFIRLPLFIPLFCVGVFYLVEERRKGFLFAAAAAPAIAAVLIQNRWIWGSWLSGGYSEAGVGFHADVPRALWGLMFGWYRGILAYSPILAVGIAGALLAVRRISSFVERRMIVLAVSSLAVILFTSRWSAWYGGTNQFGYRLLLDVVPFVVVLTAYGLARSERLRMIALLLGALSIMTMTFGAAPNDFGFDSGPLFPSALADTSLGQAWINFIHHPVGGVVRLLGVAGVGGLLFALAPERSDGQTADRVIAA
ncbi:MAG: hypothetical protein WAT66_07560 [Actinomycetota bacterium]